MHLNYMQKSERKTEEDLWRDFNALYPSFLGAMYDAVAAGLRALPTIVPSGLPRMGDFGKWGLALEAGLGWTPGAFADAHETNVANARKGALEQSLVATALCRFLAGNVKVIPKLKPWTGTATDLLMYLNVVVGPDVVASDRWPKSGHTLSSTLRRLAVAFREIGVQIDFDIRSKDTRLLTIGLDKTLDVSPFIPSAPTGYSLLASIQRGLIEGR
jgi:hypothetical protein